MKMERIKTTMKIRLNLRKIAAASLAVVYFHVNVLFAGVPSAQSGIANSLTSLFTYFKFHQTVNPDDVLVFHSSPWDEHAWLDDRFFEQQTNPPSQADLNKIQQTPQSNSFRIEPVSQSRQIPDDTQATLKKDIRNIQSTNGPNKEQIFLTLDDVLEFKSLKPEQKTELEKAFIGKTVEVSLFRIGSTMIVNLKSSDGKIKASLDYAPHLKNPTLQMAVAPEKVQSQKFQIQTAHIEKEFAKGSTTKLSDDLRKAVRQLGFRGDLGDIRSLAVDPVRGARFIRTEEGLKFQGQITWITQQGVKYEVIGISNGNVQLTRTASATVTETDYFRGGKSLITLPAGTSETRLVNLN